MPSRVSRGTLFIALLAILASREPRHSAVASDGAEARAVESGDWWAYRQLARPAVPAVTDGEWARNPIDAFVLAKLQERGLKPVGPAGNVALMRRAYYDLIGLPPTPAEVDAFVADTSPDAFAKVIDRLLDSPHYGEKWGRHWLDLVRYGETNGYERDGTKPFAWRYRDYVIRSFNEDKPYDQFIREQLAGDEIEPVTADGIIATGYYRLGLWDDEPVDAMQSRYDELDDYVTTTGQVFLGTTINCARCHDHKADPVTQADYYRLLAFFQDVAHYSDTRNVRSRFNVTDISPPEVRAAYEDELKRREALQEELAAAMRQIEDEGIAKMPAEDRLAAVGMDRQVVIDRKLKMFITEEQGAEYAKLKAELETLKKLPEPAHRELALSVNHCTVPPPDTHILARGSPHAPGAKVEPGFPRVLGSPDPALPRAQPGARTAGRRRVLADWIAAPQNPLTARVIANRLWQHHFGRGIVRTTNDFGKLGEPPTHPELLDWLAAELIDPSPRPSPRRGEGVSLGVASPSPLRGEGRGEGSAAAWSMKRMHKLIMLSSAYQMSSRDDPEGQRVDPANDLFWRFDPRRLTAEELRDSILAVNGSLNPKMAGPSIYTEVPYAVLHTASRPDAAWGKSTPEDQARRSVYIFVKRSLLEPVLNTFDVPDPDSSCAVRFATTVPTQSLTSLNSEFFNKHARLLTERLRKEAGERPEDQVRLGLRLLTLRQPSDAEVRRCLRLLDELQQRDGLSSEAAMNAVCLMMLNLNEFVYLD
jgi:hypothetical protein